MVYCRDHTMFTICTKSFTLTTEHIEGDIKTNLRPQEFYCPETVPLVLKFLDPPMLTTF